jgi:hypothetical protein
VCCGWQSFIDNKPYAWQFPQITPKGRERIELFAKEQFLHLSESIAYIISKDIITSLDKIKQSITNSNDSIIESLEENAPRIPDLTKYTLIFKCITIVYFILEMPVIFAI